MPRCDRCRREYSSGAYYKGHDYCMLCYSLIKEEEEKRKRQLEEAAKERKELEKRRALEEEERRKREEAAREREELKKRRMLEEEKRAMFLEERREEFEEEKRKRLEEERRLELLEEKPALLAAKKMPSAVKKPFAKPAPEIRTYMPGKKPAAKKEKEKEEEKKEKEEEEKEEVLLEVVSSLPVSLSVGQKENKVVLLGRNKTKSRKVFGLNVSISDSKNNAVESKILPKQCEIDVSGESKFEIMFDIPENAERGLLKFSAYLKEIAEYIGKEPAQSNKLLLETQLKTPMELAYKKGSASVFLEEGNVFFSLVFDNLGESGGILSVKSSLSYVKEGKTEVLQLEAQKKIKGFEKDVLLRFPAKEEKLPEKMNAALVGVDSNGKPYKKLFRVA